MSKLLLRETFSEEFSKRIPVGLYTGCKFYYLKEANA